MKIFISGFGTVGQGILELIMLKENVFAKYGGVKVTGIMDSKTYVINSDGICGLCVLGKKKSMGVCSDIERKGKEGCDILDMVDYDVLIECTPTNVDDGGEGLKNISYALSKGKDVITTNKGPLALRFKELSELAKKNNCVFRYEGSVGGAMPIISLCNEGLIGQKIKSIKGVFNGTCNFILSKMDNGMSFLQAFKEAQQLGYVEKDPNYDIKGIDSASKVTILANAVFGRNVTIKDVAITGIDTITEEAVSLAADRGMVIRLIGEVSENTLSVSPRLVPKGHPLSLSGTLNVAVVETDYAGMITISGRGAGKMETASAILNDLLAIMQKRQ